MTRPSLRRVLIAAIGGVALGAVIVTAVVSIGLVRLTAERSALADMNRDADELVAALEDASRPRVAMRQAVGPQVQFVPSGGPPVAEPPPDVLVVTREAVVRGVPGTLYLFRPRTAAAPFGAGVVQRVIIAGLLAFALAAAVAVVVSRRIARPLGELSGAARRLAHGERVPVPSGQEVAEVAELRDSFVQMSDDLRRARELERSFLLSVSHELKTPLTAIRGWGEAMADGTASGDERTGEIILGESRRLERLVADLIDLARLEAGEFSVRMTDVALDELARGVADTLKPRATEVTLQVESTDAAIVQTDPDRAHQMLANLAENALRVTPAGGRVTLRVQGRRVQVGDTGPGLASEDLEHVFERFYLWRRYRGERPCGTGLGLAIVDELAVKLGIAVSVDSQPNAGTTFTVEFS